MKILIIGASGLIGRTVYNSLKDGHEVFGAYRSSNEYPVNTTSKESIRLLFDNLPKLDAVINVAGTAPFKAFEALSEDDYYEGIKDKLMGQVNLVHIAKDYLNQGASITLTTGILADYPESGSTALALVNGALHSFVMAAAPFMNNGIRLNVVSPGSVENTGGENELFAEHAAVSMDAVINVYKESLFGSKTGQVFKIY